MDVMEMEEKVMDASVEGPREKLRQILEKNGETILQDPDRVEGLLRDHCGPYRKEISALVGALNERVPLELKGSWQSAMTPEAMRARMVQRLEDHRGLNSDVAAWAVDTWSYALGIGLGRHSDRLDSVVLQDDSKFKKTDGAIGGLGLLGGAGGNFNGQGNGGVNQTQSDIARQAAIDSDRPGGAAAVKPGLLTTPAQKKNVGIGAGLIALALVAGLAIGHKPAPPPKQDDNPVKKQDDTPKPPAVVSTPAVVTAPVVASAIAAGTTLQIRLNQAINSNAVTPGETFTATLAAPLMLNSKVVLPLGADATIKVVSVDEGGKLSGQTVMLLSLVEVASGGKRYSVSAAPHQVLGQKQVVEAAKRGAIGAGVGAVTGFFTGKILGHAKAGTVAGTGAGTAVGVATTKPQPAKVKAEELMRFRLTKPLAIGS